MTKQDEDLIRRVWTACRERARVRLPYVPLAGSAEWPVIARTWTFLCDAFYLAHSTDAAKLKELRSISRATLRALKAYEQARGQVEGDADLIPPAKRVLRRLMRKRGV